MALGPKYIIGFITVTGSLLLLWWFLFGSTEIEGENQRVSENAAGLSGENAVGQTFAARYENLTRIDVKFSSFQEGTHHITFVLKEFSTPLELCEPAQQPVQTGSVIYKLSPQEQIGQTFRADCPNLHAIHVRISSSQLSDQGVLIFRLKRTPDAQDVIAEIRRAVPLIKKNQYNSFEFPPLHNSQGAMYYFELRVEGLLPGNALRIPYTLGSNYSEGNGYVNERFLSGDVLFKKSYRNPLKKHAALFHIQTNISPPPNGYSTFRFPPIRHSKGKYYYFFVELQNNMLALWEANNNLYAQGSKILNHAPVPGELTFRSAYKVSIAEAFHVLLTRMTYNKPSWFSKKYVYIMVYGSYLVLLALFLGILILDGKKEGQGIGKNR